MAYLGTKPANQVIDSTLIADGTITTSDLANQAVTQDKIANSSVTQAKVASGVAGTGPAFSAYASSATSITTGTWTKIQFQAEEFDTANCFDSTTNYRFTPNVAGYYQINLSSGVNGGGSFEQTIMLYKNGSPFKQYMDIAATNIWLINGSSLVYMNGSTDYLEGYYYQNSGITKNLYTGSQICVFQGVMVRAT